MSCAARHCVFESRPLRQTMRMDIIIQFAKLEKPIIKYLIIGFFLFYNHDTASRDDSAISSRILLLMFSPATP